MFIFIKYKICVSVLSPSRFISIRVHIYIVSNINYIIFYKNRNHNITKNMFNWFLICHCSWHTLWLFNNVATFIFCFCLLLLNNMFGYFIFLNTFINTFYFLCIMKFLDKVSMRWNFNFSHWIFNFVEEINLWMWYNWLH